MQMILLGTPILAEEARSAGLVADIFEPGSVLDKVVEIASKLASMSGTALSLAKEAVCRCKCFSIVNASSSSALA
jgi:enoyl-CoA hydratase